MLITIIGENETADRVRHLIGEGGGRIVEHTPAYTFVIRESGTEAIPVVDGVDSPLEAKFVNLLTELSPSGRVLLKRNGVNQDDRALVLTVPAVDVERAAAALAIYRTVTQLTDRRRRWLRWLFPVLLLLAVPAAAQVTGGYVDQGTANSGTSPWNIQFVTVPHIICDSGCGSPAATADGTAFVSGTTNVSPVAFVVDDVATTTVPENSYGAARMSGSRILYSDLSQSASNTNSFKVDFGGSAQPISVASLPLPALASTSTLQTTGNASLSSIDTSLTTVNATLTAIQTVLQANAGLSGRSGLLLSCNALRRSNCR